MNSFNEIHFEELDSTSLYLKREHNNLDNLTIVSASFQTNGRGREDRVWISEKNANLLFSILVKDQKLINLYPYLSLGMAIGVAKGLESIGLDNVSIKWPNDVYVGSKKICGILLEGSVPSYLSLGIGINVNQTQFREDLRTPATSIKLQLNKDLDFELVKQTIYSSCLDVLNDLSNDEFSFMDYLTSHDYLKGKKVLAEIDNQTREVEVIGINNKNCLLAVKYNNEIKELSTGEISFSDILPPLIEVGASCSRIL